MTASLLILFVLLLLSIIFIFSTTFFDTTDSPNTTITHIKPVNIISANTTLTHIKPVNIISANTTSANTTSANTTPANTTSANTTSADTTSADTTSANTTSANTTSANTTSADITSADTTSANTTLANTTTETELFNKRSTFDLYMDKSDSAIPRNYEELKKVCTNKGLELCEQQYICDSNYIESDLEYKVENEDIIYIPVKKTDDGNKWTYYKYGKINTGGHGGHGGRIFGKTMCIPFDIDEDNLNNKNIAVKCCKADINNEETKYEHKEHSHDNINRQHSHDKDNKIITDFSVSHIHEKETDNINADNDYGFSNGELHSHIHNSQFTNDYIPHSHDEQNTVPNFNKVKPHIHYGIQGNLIKYVDGDTFDVKEYGFDHVHTDEQKKDIIGEEDDYIAIYNPSGGVPHSHRIRGGHGGGGITRPRYHKHNGDDIAYFGNNYDPIKYKHSHIGGGHGDGSHYHVGNNIKTDADIKHYHQYNNKIKIM